MSAIECDYADTVIVSHGGNGLFEMRQRGTCCPVRILCPNHLSLLLLDNRLGMVLTKGAQIHIKTAGVVA